MRVFVCKYCMLCLFTSYDLNGFSFSVNEGTKEKTTSGRSGEKGNESRGEEKGEALSYLYVPPLPTITSVNS
jgi:hypothetical protein